MSEAVVSSIAQPGAGTLRLLPDDRLARSAARGEQRAFAAIFQRYHQELFRYCRAILRDEEEARDALQNTMIRVLDALPGEEREIALRPWLYRIAHNEAISLLRQRPSVAEPDDELAVPGPEDQAETRERLRYLVSDLGALPERQRSALVMRELSGIDYTEIGDVLGTSSAGARQTVYEARVALQEMSEGRATACREVQRSLSAADGRVLRGRKVRAHVRGCVACQDFRAGIRQRRADLAALAPPLPAVAAAGLLHSVLGAGHGGGGGGGLLGLLGAGSGKAVATSAAVKSAAAVVATATVGVGAAGVTGVADPPLIGGESTPQAGADAAKPAGPNWEHATQARIGNGAAVSGQASMASKRALAIKQSAAQHAAGKRSHGVAHGRSASSTYPAGSPNGSPRGPEYGQQGANAHAPGTRSAPSQGPVPRISGQSSPPERGKPARKAKLSTPPGRLRNLPIADP
jgi:RNA polymerase sigma factor (sigma-70 family)